MDYSSMRLNLKAGLITYLSRLNTQRINTTTLARKYELAITEASRNMSPTTPPIAIPNIPIIPTGRHDIAMPYINNSLKKLQPGTTENNKASRNALDWNS